ncbi:MULTISPECIES: type II toxin-antitoxin system VapC family toxin [unclassified Novosphingobium]|uniref:type II toxin-antitoxin system VapC family toxin n=1 Tax=unclassified Novosphingobium TaxID=2644732 RepID=UPI00135BBA4F|nr:MULTISPECIES: type II toxin-antitoxin system VapC family toxin [unclassified Novosphingobium]
MTAFFDTSAVIALSDPQEPNHAWSMSEFTARQAEGPIVISDVIYAEVSVGMNAREDVDAIIQQFGLERAERDDGALFDAAKRFHKYKKKDGGPKLNVLPDFFIGAAARSLDIPLVTANPKDFRHFFSGLRIVHPNGEEVVP